MELEGTYEPTRTGGIVRVYRGRFLATEAVVADIDEAAAVLDQRGFRVYGWSEQVVGPGFRTRSIREIDT